jgi:hypothetical protein
MAEVRVIERELTIAIVRGLPRAVPVVIVKDERGDVALVNWRELLRPSTWRALFR